MRREGDKLTPRINTLTRRDSWRERDPYASPYRRDPHRAWWRVRPRAEQRAERSQRVFVVVAAPTEAAARLRRAAAAARPAVPRPRPVPTPGPESARPVCARPRPVRARPGPLRPGPRPVCAGPRDPYRAGDRDPYARPASRDRDTRAAAFVVAGPGPVRAAAVVVAGPRPLRAAAVVVAGPGPLRAADIVVAGPGPVRAAGVAGPRPVPPRPAAHEKPPREYEGELDPRSGTERWRPVRDEEGGS